MPAAVIHENRNVPEVSGGLGPVLVNTGRPELLHSIVKQTSSVVSLNLLSGTVVSQFLFVHKLHALFAQLGVSLLVSYRHLLVVD